jgi:Signal transduction histidine kinase involved in nitrogen fixation and metabolism regulation
VTTRPKGQWSRRILVGWKVLDHRYELERKLAFGVVVAAIVCGIVTVAMWTGATGFGPNPNTVIVLLYLDSILLLLLGAIVAVKLVRVWAERRRGLAGSGLHVRIVLLFSVVAVTPAILVAVFSALFLNFGIQAWFSERVRTAIEASDRVARAYLLEHRQSIGADAFAIANELNKGASDLMQDQRLFEERLSVLAALRGLSEALVVDSSGRVVAQAALSLTPDKDVIPWQAIEDAAKGQVVILTSAPDDRVRAAIKLNRFVDAYLIVGRFIDPTVQEPIQRTERAVAQYRRLEESREGILITFVMIFGLVALLLLLAAVWIGLTLASQITRPISNLITAAERVRHGDLSIRVKSDASVGEIGTLNRAFNRMTGQIQSQQETLIEANRSLDERRRFTEAVLSGVSAGVIGLDRDGLIKLPNRPASDLLGFDLDKANGVPLGDVAPEMASLLTSAMGRPDRQWQSEVRLVRDGRSYTFVARIVAEKMDGDVVGYVVTFDDITALVSAERKAAWADVARRIAHEIKNPLTPIQLASERLKRRYLKEIQSDPDTFTACTETIIRHVEDIGRMVDEFSSFARMPRPNLQMEDLRSIVEQGIFLERNRYPTIELKSELPADPVLLLCDNRQIAQAIVNVLKNAAEAIIGRELSGHTPLPPGQITVRIIPRTDRGAGEIELVVEDNGRGLPEENRDRLTEPYVTTRAKGTGLGLAIVKKIMEDHQGEIILTDREGGGTRVVLLFHGNATFDRQGFTEVRTKQTAAAAS